MIALLGCMSCIIMTETQNLFLAVALTVLLGAFIGYLYGISVTTFKIPGFITGLAFNSVASGVILLITGGVAVSYTGLGNFRVLGQGYLRHHYGPYFARLSFSSLPVLLWPQGLRRGWQPGCGYYFRHQC